MVPAIATKAIIQPRAISFNTGDVYPDYFCTGLCSYL